MATITALGIGSGLDANSIIESLMEIERRPLTNLQVKEAAYYTEMSAVGQLRSAVASFQDAAEALSTASTYEVYTATSADTAIFTASASSSAAVGTYDIQVTSLAVAQKQGSNSFSDSDTTTVGSAGDTVEVTIGSDSFSVEIGGKTLEEIADAINSASDNVGVTASVIQEDSNNYYLTLTSDETGIDNEMTLAFEDSGGSSIADPLGMAVTQAADDAGLLIDNTYNVTRSSNSITDVIEGVTLNLLDTSASAVELDVDINQSSITASAAAFVTAYNTLQSTMSELSDGELSGDYTIRSLQSQVRSIINTTPTGLSGNLSYLSEVGFDIDKNGVMSIDSSTLSDEISTNLDSVIELFSDDDQGYAFRLNGLLENVLGSDGMLDSKEDGINARIDDVQDAQEAMAYRLEIIEAKYRAQYAALDTLMSNLTATSSYLDQQLSILANLIPGNSNN